MLNLYCFFIYLDYSLSEASTLQSNNNKTEPTSKRRRASAKKVAKDKRTRKKPKNVQPLRRFSYEADESGVYRYYSTAHIPII